MSDLFLRRLPSPISLHLGSKKEKEKKRCFFKKQKRGNSFLFLSLSTNYFSFTSKNLPFFSFFSSFGLCGFPTENERGGGGGRECTCLIIMQAGNAGTRGDGSPAYFDKRDYMITCIYAASLNFFFFCARAPNERGGFRLERICIYMLCDMLKRILVCTYAMSSCMRPTDMGL